MMGLALHLTLVLFTLAFSILAVELKDMLKAILSFMVANVFLSAILYLLGAHYLAVFQLLIYAGAVTILFLVTIHVGEEVEETRNTAFTKLKILSMILAVLLIAILLVHSPRIVEGVKAPLLGLTSFEEHPEFLWVNRWLDLLIQAFIILVVAASISIQLMREKHEERGVREE